MKHVEVRQKYSAARVIFNSLLGVSSSDETLRLMLDKLHGGKSSYFLNFFKLNDLLFQTSHIAIDHKISTIAWICFNNFFLNEIGET